MKVTTDALELEQRGTLVQFMPVLYTLLGLACVPWAYVVFVLREPFVGLMMTLVVVLFGGVVIVLRLVARDRPVWHMNENSLVVKSRSGVTEMPWPQIARIHLRRHGLPVTFPAWLEVEGRGPDAPMPLRVAPQEVASLSKLDMLLTRLLDRAPAEVVDIEVALLAAFVRESLSERGPKAGVPILDAARRMDCGGVIRSGDCEDGLSSREGFVRAACHYFKGDFEESARAAELALESQPDSWNVLLCVALGYERAGNAELARQTADRMLASDRVEHRAVIQAWRDQM